MILIHLIIVIHFPV
uniref:Uncharacterized protein n=1 Tax=Rhizophora mucronata TaxID=61149 RepID=A0A2P2QUA5_RHIMU